ncbi:hypothetical protein ACNUDN_08215 [Mycobacterium sp. smrl_JER01]|uniref:hypothetical protein n=1 Tax=Mycobacterium sp. smrl_JER01 TaxID=3402633 RepID=UPI003AC67FF0
MNSDSTNGNITFSGVVAAGMSRTLRAPQGAHPAHPAAAIAAAAAPRKRRAADGTVAASVRGYL